MRCLLIDDDIPTLDALKQIIDWSELGFINVTQATNIHDAMRILEVQLIDLILCDIEMPRGTGLELLKWTYDNQHQARFIFLTCHDSFEFASEAIIYNVDSYLLKPLDPTKIKAALMKSINQVQKKVEHSKQVENSQHWLNNIKVVEKGFWRDIVMANIYPDEKTIKTEALKRSLVNVNAHHHFFSQLLCVDTSKLNVKWDESLFIAALTNVVEELLESLCSYIYTFAYKQQDVCYIYCLLPSDQYGLEQHGIGKQLIEACKIYLKVEATVYVSEKVKAENLFQTRLELEQLHLQNMTAYGKVYFYSEVNVPESKFHYNFNDYLELFQVKDKVKIVNGVKEQLDSLASKNALTIDVLISIRQDFMQVCYTYLTSHEIKAHQLFADQSSKLLYSRAERSSYDFIKWAYYVCDKAIELVKESKKFTGVLDNALHYIHSHYKHNIAREDIAAHVYLNADYFAKLFKQKVGKSLSEYINEYRIKKAKQLMFETNLSISEIALETGFENSSYFSTIFKKHTGFTPIHYRTSIK